MEEEDDNKMHRMEYGERKRKSNAGRKRKGKEEEHRGWILGRMERWFPLLVVLQNLGVFDPASGDTQSREGKMEELRRDKEMVRNSWAEKRDKRNFQEKGRRTMRSEMQKPPKTLRCTQLNE